METARRYCLRGQKHAVSALVLHGASFNYGRDCGVPEESLEEFAFRGELSASVFYLMAMALEFLLKAAYLAGGGCERQARSFQHNLQQALDALGAQGFRSQSAHLSDIVGYMAEPYRLHAFRYDDHGEFPLPCDMQQVREMFETLRDEVQALLV